MKTNYDVFNGDADGICALHQLRLVTPRDSVLISGVKRDISLLKHVDSAMAKNVTVLDIALGKNRIALNQLLSQGAKIFYVDHHDPDIIPAHPLLVTHIYNNKNICTSLIIDKLLKGRIQHWALVGAYGDNLIDVANRLAKKNTLNEKERTALMRLGMYLNYNGYGNCVADLLFSPIEIYRSLSPYASPFRFILERDDIYKKLEQCFLEDSEKSRSVMPYSQEKDSRVFILPDAPWARRISGVYSNTLANQDPTLANAVITHTQNGHYAVSIRSPLNKQSGADKLAALFPTGGGRKAAAGINSLTPEQLSAFILSFHQHYRARVK